MMKRMLVTMSLSERVMKSYAEKWEEEGPFWRKGAGTDSMLPWRTGLRWK